MFIFFCCFLLISCKQNSSNASSINTSSSLPKITYNFLDGLNNLDEDRDPCFFNVSSQARVKMILSEELMEDLPLGVMSPMDVNTIFSCINCGSLEIIKINNISYEIAITPVDQEYNDEIVFGINDNFLKTKNNTSYLQDTPKTCVISTLFTTTVIEEPSNISEMVNLDFSSIGESSPGSLNLSMPISRNQKCNSCIAWSSNYALSYYNWVASGSPFSGQDPDYNNVATSPYYAYTLRTNNPKTCQDTVTYKHIFDIFKERGSASVATMPLSSFNDQNGTYPGVSANYNPLNTFDINAVQSKILGVLKIHSKSINSLKGALSLGNPLLFSVNLSKNFDKIKINAPLWIFENDVIYQNSGHALTLVGYDDNYNNTGEGAFRFLNSWGEEFGIEGSGWISYTDFLDIRRVPGEYVFMFIPAAKFATGNTPVARYTFENTLNSLTGTHHGSGQGIAYGPGKNGQGIVFAGSSFVDLGTNFDFQDGYSVSVWIKPSANISTEQVLISQVYGANGLNSGFEVGIENNRIFTRSFDGNFVEKSSLSLETSPVTLNWNHLVVTWNKAYIKTFLNNTLVNVKALNTAIHPNTINKKIYLGRKASYTNSPAYYSGTMDYLKIYQQPLNDIDVKNIFEGGN